MYMRHYVGWFVVCLNQEGELAGHDAFGIAWVDTVHLAERGGSHGQGSRPEAEIAGLEVIENSP